MNQGKWVPPSRHRDGRDLCPAPKRHDPEPSGARGRCILLLAGALGVMLACAGSAAAGSLITGKDIKDDTITSSDLRDGRLQGVDVRDGTLTRTDFGKLPVGAAGPQGGQGLAGSNGAQGVRRPQETRNLLGGQSTIFRVDCPAGTQVVGGGVSSDQPQDLYIFASKPGTFGWQVSAQNIGGGLAQVTASAVCVH